MHKVSRSLLLAGVLAFGTLTAACGDKVQVNSVSPITGVQSVTVTPSSATIAAGAANAIQLALNVVADGTTSKTVTWTSSSPTVATVDAAGKVTGVGAGTATIIATSTADASKAGASVITVTGTSTPANTPNTVAISTVNQPNAFGQEVPVNLAAVAGQVDVTLFVSGPSGTLNLIQNCTAAGATSTTGDVIVAQQVVAGSQNQTPVTLSYNTAARGVITSGIAVPSATSSTPIALNGPCVLKAQLGTATATNVTPMTLANANVFVATTTFTKTTTLGSQNVISNANGLVYSQGDLTVALSPVVYSRDAAGAAQVPAVASVTYAGRTIAATATAGKFSVTFPSSQASSTAASGTQLVSIYQYTSPAAGDVVTIAGYADTNGQQIFTSGAPVLTPGTVLRSDNGSPNLLTFPTGVAGNFGTVGGMTENLNPFTTARNYINASYTFGTAANQAQTGTDQAYAASQITTNFYYGALPSTGLPNAGGTANPASANCSTTGLTKVATGADIPQTPFSAANGFAPGYYVRAIQNDPLGNVYCQDFGVTNGITGFGVDKQAPNALVVTAGTNGSANDQSVITTGATNSFFSVDSVSGFNPGSELRVTSIRGFSGANCVIGVPNAAGTTCSPTNSGFNVNIDNGTGTQGYYQVSVFAQDQAGNASPTLVRTYLIDTTIPTVGGISIPQTLTGGSSITFTSTANDNIDLKSSNFDITYSAAAGAPVLYYTGDNYGPNYDATVVKTAPLNATVPFFIKQIQNTTAGGAPVAFATGTGSDSGKATTITVRAIDAANLQSANSFAAIPAINIANSAGFTTSLSTFSVTTNNPAVAGAFPLSNGAAGAGTQPRSGTLSAAAQLGSAATPNVNAQSANVPFAQVCFFYQQTAASFAGTTNPTIPVGDLVSVGCVSQPDIADVANVSRTWTYRLAGFDPPAEFGTAGSVKIFAVGVNSNGVGIISQGDNSVTLTP